MQIILAFLLIIKSYSYEVELYLELSQTSKVELLSEIVKAWMFDRVLNTPLQGE